MEGWKLAHTLISLLAAIGALFVLVVGSYILYWNLSVYRALTSRMLKNRVAWTAALILLLIIFLGVWGTAGSTHALPPRSGIGLFLRSFAVVLSYAAGDYTMKVARRYDLVQVRRAMPERLVWALSPLVWPWVILNLLLSFLNIVLEEPLLTALIELVLPLVTLLFFWPVTIAGMISARGWVVDQRLRENMKWYVYLLASIAITVWSSYVVVTVLGVRGAVGFQGIGVFVSTIFFPAVIYTAYKSSKSLVVTHKLPT